MHAKLTSTTAQVEKLLDANISLQAQLQSQQQEQKELKEHMPVPAPVPVVVRTNIIITTNHLQSIATMHFHNCCYSGYPIIWATIHTY